MLFKTLIISHFICISFNLLHSQDCGVERWPVKTLSDTDTLKIKFDTILESSVHEQINLETPFGRLHERIVSETSLYAFDCCIMGFKKEKDKDIHIVIEDTKSNETMVIELVSPECESVKQTSRYHPIDDLYRWFEDNIGVPNHSFKILEVPIPIFIIGIGFWDYLHGQKGMARNGREIHPVLWMKRR